MSFWHRKISPSRSSRPDIHAILDAELNRHHDVVSELLEYAYEHDHLNKQGVNSDDDFPQKPR